MSIGLPPQCLTCAHWASPLDNAGERQACAAFPAGIPEKIWTNQADHRRRFPDDSGIRWQPRGGATFPDWAMVRPGPTARAPRVVNVDSFDLSAVQDQWEAQLDDLLNAWVPVTARQRERIVEQVRYAVTNNDLAALASLTTSTAEAVEALTAAMNEMALTAAEQMSQELARQGIRADPVAVDTEVFSRIAATVAVLLAQGLTNSAGREALRRWSPNTTGDQVAAAVREHLESLSDTFLRDHLGGALSAAETAGRMATALAAPTTSIYASERLDASTCPPCLKIHGRWLGNTDDPATPERVEAVYPNGGYVDCEGGVRCRGQIVAVLRPQQVSAEPG